MKTTKKCPHCDNTELHRFDSNNDWCSVCKNWFPSTEATKIEFRFNKQDMLDFVKFWYEGSDFDNYEQSFNKWYTQRCTEGETTMSPRPANNCSILVLQDISSPNERYVVHLRFPNMATSPFLPIVDSISVEEKTTNAVGEEFFVTINETNWEKRACGIMQWLVNMFAATHNKETYLNQLEVIQCIIPEEHLGNHNEVMSTILGFAIGKSKTRLPKK